jgi:hypothetical protein
LYNDDIFSEDITAAGGEQALRVAGAALDADYIESRRAERKAAREERYRKHIVQAEELLYPHIPDIIDIDHLGMRKSWEAIIRDAAMYEADDPHMDTEWVFTPAYIVYFCSQPTNRRLIINQSIVKQRPIGSSNETSRSATWGRMTPEQFEKYMTRSVAVVVGDGKKGIVGSFDTRAELVKGIGLDIDPLVLTGHERLMEKHKRPEIR